MAYERNWQFIPMQGPRVQASFSDGASYWLWLVAQILLGRVGGATQGLWTIHYSHGSGVVGVAGDGVDNWGTPYNLANVPYSANANALHAWMVLKRNFTVGVTTHTVYMLLSAHGNSTNGDVFVEFAETVSGGTSTVDPTLSQPISRRPTSQPVNNFSLDSTNSRRYYGALSATGDFWLAETITGELSRGVLFFVPVGTKNNDQFPFFASHQEAGHPNGYAVFSGNVLFTRNSSYLNPGSFYNGGAGFARLGTPGEGVTDHLDVSDLSIFDRPSFVEVSNQQQATPTQVHSRGRLPDVGLGGNTVVVVPSRPCNIGTTIRNQGGGVEYVTMNQLILPYNGLIS